jgi:hypothetical protein
LVANLCQLALALSIPNGRFINAVDQSDPDHAHSVGALPDAHNAKRHTGSVPFDVALELAAGDP